MIAFTVNYLVAKSPRIRRFLWRHIYETLARLFADLDWNFLSYGYVRLDGVPVPLALEAEDEPYRAFLQLYHHVGNSAGLHGKDVLEVSSGRGGGSAFMAKYMGARRTVALDRAIGAVSHSGRRHRRSGLAFLAADAEALPFRDASFDVVVSVESSHCYGSMVGFLHEVRRVLRPGGSLVWADMRNTVDVPRTDADFEAADLRPTIKEDITANVLASLDQTNAFKMHLVHAHSPRLLLPLMKQFAGVPGSTIYQEFANGEKQYLHYACRRV
jgi:ubiquinone/menaquinone biosynthesis C-methylase UbiE